MSWTKELLNKLSQDKNADGQPRIAGFRSAAVKERQVDELIGLIKGVLADGVVCKGEAEYLLKWMEANQGALNEWPAKVIYPRVVAALEDGILDRAEEAELLELLQKTVGSDDAVEQGWSSGSSTLPLCSPAPIIEVPDRLFCFTGKFNSGTRDWCHERVAELGGVPTKGITKKLDYLVIGDIGSRDWLHSTHGTKILKAVEYRNSGVPLRIISERHWFERLIT